MISNNRIFLIIVGIVIIGLLVWQFLNILVYVLIASVLSIMGKPLIKALNKIKFKKFYLPKALCAFITLLTFWLIGFLFFKTILPLLAHQAYNLSEIDITTFHNSLAEPIIYSEALLAKYNIVINTESFSQKITNQLYSIIEKINLPDIIQYFIGFAGNILITFFAVSFITFFFLKDDKLLFNVIMLLTPYSYQQEIRNILKRCQKMLSRYFLGLLLDLTLVITLITIGMSIVGLENALIIGFFAGIMNIIPYVGPIIGASLGIFFGVTANLNMDFQTQMLPMVFFMALVFAIVNLVDAMILQPTIYSNSVKAHPLEIFIVILSAGTLAGIPGMILAIPSYTVLRIIAKEFLSKYRVIDKLTENLN